MQKMFLFFLLILGLTGCGSDTQKEETSIVKNILSTEVRYDWNEQKYLLHSKYFERLENQVELDQFISEIDNNFSRIEVDFEKYNVLVYCTRYNANSQTDEYREEIILESNDTVKIEQIFTGHKRDEGDYYTKALQLRLYQIDKSINSVEMIHEDEVSQISMDNPSKLLQNKVINFFVYSQHFGKTGAKVLDNNESYQLFLEEQNLTEKLTTDIDFEKYQVLCRVRSSEVCQIYSIEEQIIVNPPSKAKIVDSYIYSKDMIHRGAPPAPILDFLFYMVDRDINLIEYYEGGELISVDME